MAQMKRREAQTTVLHMLRQNPEGMTFKQLGAALWPGKRATHLPAGRVVAELIWKGFAARNEYGTVTITPSGAAAVGG